MNIEQMKMKVELMKVEASRFEMELKIAQRLEEVENLKKQIDIQDARISELKDQMEG